MQSPLYQPDTNILVHYARGDWIQQKMEPIYQLLLTPTIPVISYVIEAEIRSLAVQLGWGEPRTKQLGFILSALEIVHINEPGIIVDCGDQQCHGRNAVDYRQGF